MNLAYIIPTRDRPEVLRRTLEALEALPPHRAQVIIIDNASAQHPRPPARLANGLGVDLISLDHNAGAAARNTGAAHADRSCDWLVMLDDDSSPMDDGHLRALAAAAPDVAAVAAEIFLPPGDDGRAIRESGGLPEVFVGCGVAIRRDAFLDRGGYDERFGFYAEEYDLSARLLLGGLRITLDRRFRVEHRKVSTGRDMNLILRRLVRNNAWIMQRYAPARARIGELANTISRYGAIARKERATAGFGRGVHELLASLRSQRRSPMPTDVWDRFTGLAAARRSLQTAYAESPFAAASVIDEGKNAHIIRAALAELGVRQTTDRHAAEALVIGTLSPGPMLDALAATTANFPRHRVVAPWNIAPRRVPLPCAAPAA
ncbi:MAG: glycosyltransferase [Phycisphaerales bacterium]|nr:glycosyltransferase [Phycisphaerales bacterium]